MSNETGSITNVLFILVGGLGLLLGIVIEYRRHGDPGLIQRIQAQQQDREWMTRIENLVTTQQKTQLSTISALVRGLAPFIPGNADLAFAEFLDDLSVPGAPTATSTLRTQDVVAHIDPVNPTTVILTVTDSSGKSHVKSIALTQHAPDSHG